MFGKKEGRRKRSRNEKRGAESGCKAGGTRSNHAGPLSRGRLADFVGTFDEAPPLLRSRLIGSDRARSTSTAGAGTEAR